MSMIQICRGLVLAALFAAGPALAAETAAKPKAAAFDARDPAGLISVLSEMGAKAEVVKSAPGEAFVSVTTPGYGFGVQFAGCDANSKACKGMAFSTAAEKKTATLAQINGFNQTSINCRAFEDKAGKAHIAYSTLLSSHDVRDEMKTHIGAWQGCVAAFGEFLKDPPGFLARAP